VANLEFIEKLMKFKQNSYCKNNNWNKIADSVKIPRMMKGKKLPNDKENIFNIMNETLVIMHKECLWFKSKQETTQQKRTKYWNTILTRGKDKWVYDIMFSMMNNQKKHLKLTNICN
jgi:hypothetical protein